MVYVIWWKMMHVLLVDPSLWVVVEGGCSDAKFVMEQKSPVQMERATKVVLQPIFPVHHGE